MAVSGLAYGAAQASAGTSPLCPGNCGPTAAPLLPSTLPTNAPIASFNLSTLKSANPTNPTEYTFEFNAFSDSTPLIFEFRDDPFFLTFYDVSVVNVRTGAQVVSNGNFQQTTLTNGTYIPTGWKYANVNAATFQGAVSFGGSVGPCKQASGCWIDGANGGYDSLSQSIPTTAGSVYKVSFYAFAGSVAQWAQTSTNSGAGIGGNAANIVAFALDADDAPEPSTWVMLAIGFAGLGYLGFRRRRRALA